MFCNLIMNDPRNFTVGDIDAGEHGLLCLTLKQDGSIGQNTYDFLLVCYRNFGRISCRFSASQFYAEMISLGNCGR